MNLTSSHVLLSTQRLFQDLGNEESFIVFLDRPIQLDLEGEVYSNAFWDQAILHVRPNEFLLGAFHYDEGIGCELEGDLGLGLIHISREQMASWIVLDPVDGDDDAPPSD